MQLILFSKMFKDRSIDQLVELAQEHGLDGYDLCVRPEYPVNPDNASEELPEAVSILRRNGLDVPMVTGNFDLLESNNPTARPILAAMAKADVRLLKLGYFRFDTETQSYLAEVDRIRTVFAGWELLGREYGVKICYHTHSNGWMGLNGGSLAHLLQGFDPACLGAYIDSAHLAVEGEAFAFAAGMVREYLSIVALKDVLLTRQEKNGHGYFEKSWPEAGKGIVDWTAVFDALADTGYGGPLTVHCEFQVPPEEFPAALKREVAFFRRFLPA